MYMQVYRRWHDLDDHGRQVNAHLRQDNDEENNRLWYLFIGEINVPEKMLDSVNFTQQQVVFNVDKYEYTEAFEGYLWGLNFVSNDIEHHI